MNSLFFFFDSTKLVVIPLQVMTLFFNRFRIIEEKGRISKMKEYKVYWIKEEFARHYYYKSDILYRFIQEYHAKQARHDLVSQFHFITESFPKDSIKSQLIRQPLNTLNLLGKDNHVEIGNSHNYISLHIAEKQIKFRCETLQDAETLLFPTLRRLHTYLFIVDSSYENFGWISPVKLSNGYNSGQVLYS